MKRALNSLSPAKHTQEAPCSKGKLPEEEEDLGSVRYKYTTVSVHSPA